ncbi:MAG: zinc-ribbon domain-containing protein [Burkholderiales bacterium]|nr:zinc-ribbon domain-containing protein [Burkholderiales bacterium]
MYCKKCGNELLASSKFCGKCGTPRSEASPTGAEDQALQAQQSCPSCGASCKVGAKFCGKCGHSFQSASLPPRQARPGADAQSNLLDQSTDAPPAAAQAEVKFDAPVKPAPDQPLHNTERSLVPKSNSNSGAKISLYAISAVVVLGAVGGGLWFFKHRGSVGVNDAMTPESRASAAAKPSAPAAEIAKTAAPVPTVAASAPPSSATSAPVEPVAPAIQPASSAGSSVSSPRDTGTAEKEPKHVQPQAAKPTRQPPNEKAQLQKANKTLDDLLK